MVLSFSVGSQLRAANIAELRGIAVARLQRYLAGGFLIADRIACPTKSIDVATVLNLGDALAQVEEDRKLLAQVV
jgi:hypothetical protein